MLKPYPVSAAVLMSRLCVTGRSDMNQNIHAPRLEALRFAKAAWLAGAPPGNATHHGPGQVAVKEVCQRCTHEQRRAGGRRVRPSGKPDCEAHEVIVIASGSTE